MRAKSKTRGIGHPILQTKGYALISKRRGQVWIWMPHENSIFLEDTDEANILLKVVHGLAAQSPLTSRFCKPSPSSQRYESGA